MRRKWMLRLTSLILAICLIGGAVSLNMTSAEADTTDVAASSAGFFYWLYTKKGDTDAYNAYLLLTTGKYGSTDITSAKDGEFYAATELGADGDATSLENLLATIQWLNECNKLRISDDIFTGCGELKVSSLLMAMAEIDTNWSSTNTGHARVFNVGENLAYGYSDPFDGWYTYEKANYIAQNGEETGHYENIVTSSYVATGFAYSSSGGLYTVTHGQVFSSSSSYAIYTVDEYEDLIEAYIAELASQDCDVVGHTLVHYPATDPGCQTTGNTEYWECYVCGKLFSDEDATTEVTAADVTIAATGHDFSVLWKAVWTSDYSKVTIYLDCANDCGYYSYITKSSSYTVTTAATCTEAGVGTYSASYNGVTVTEEVEIAALGHTLTYYAGTDATCTEDGTEAYWVCETCGKYFADGDGTTEISAPATISATGHNYEAVNTVEASCTEDGYTTYTCTTCGDTYTVTIEATGHTFGEWETITDSTCTEEGTKQRSCTVCGYTETETIDASGHEWEDDYTVDEEATCTEAGSKSIHCVNCDAVKDSVVIPATGHSYELTETVEATCTEAGYTTYTCTVCGDSYSVEIAATGHTSGEVVTENETEATCTMDGSYDVVVYCTVCGEEISRETVTIPATGHSYELTGTVEATCTEGGSETYTCAVCGDTYTEMTEALGHSAGEAVTENEVAATCTEDGSYDSVAYCTVCGEEISRETVTVEATGHSYEVTDSEDATCTEDGSVTYTCTVCGDTYTEVVEATGHTAGEAVVENEIAATCEEAGSYDSVVYCTVCGVELSRETVTVDALGHDYEVTESEDATCTEDGSVTYTCTVCGDTYTEVVEATGHTAGEAVVENEIAATCTEAGSYDSVVYCTVCGEELSRETVTVDAIGHNYEVTETVEATCITDGYVVYTCTNCGSTYTITTDMTGLHVSGEAVIENEIAATCEEAGSYDSVVYCTVCGEELSRETVTTAATGHSYEVTDSEDATCTEDGSVTYTCTVCGDTYTETTDALGHTEGEAVIENEIAATCEETGSYDSVIYCTVCGTEISRETVTVDALGHDWTLDSVVWAEDYSSAYVTLACSNDESHTATVEAEVVSSTDEAGNTVYTLTVVDYDGFTYSETKTVEVETTTEAETEEETTTADTEEETTTEAETEEETTTEAETEEETTTEAETEEETTTEAETEEETTTEAETEEETTTAADTEEETTTEADTEEETTTEAETEEETTTATETEEETTTAADTTESSASASNEGTTESDETTAASSDSDSVETGDNSSVMLWLSVLAIGVVGVLGVSEIRRRQRGNR